MINIYTDGIKNLYLGVNLVQAVYLGVNLIWPDDVGFTRGVYYLFLPASEGSGATYQIFGKYQQENNSSGNIEWCYPTIPTSGLDIGNFSLINPVPGATISNGEQYYLWEVNVIGDNPEGLVNINGGNALLEVEFPVAELIKPVTSSGTGYKIKGVIVAHVQTSGGTNNVQSVWEYGMSSKSGIMMYTTSGIFCPARTDRLIFVLNHLHCYIWDNLQHWHLLTGTLISAPSSPTHFYVFDISKDAVLDGLNYSFTIANIKNADFTKGFYISDTKDPNEVGYDIGIKTNNTINYIVLQHKRFLSI